MHESHNISIEATILKLTQPYLSNAILTTDNTLSTNGQHSVYNVHILVSGWHKAFTKTHSQPVNIIPRSFYTCQGNDGTQGFPQVFF